MNFKKHADRNFPHWNRRFQSLRTHPQRLLFPIFSVACKRVISTCGATSPINIKRRAISTTGKQAETSCVGRNNVNSSMDRLGTCNWVPRINVFRRETRRCKHTSFLSQFSPLIFLPFGRPTLHWYYSFLSRDFFFLVEFTSNVESIEQH